MKSIHEVIEEVREHLMGSYTFEGTEMWFNRPRVQLGGKTPIQAIMEGPDGIKKVMDLAESLEAGNFT
mgnify:FL=1